MGTEGRGEVAARWSVSTMFFINGAVLASWLPHIPAVKERHALDEGVLGLVLLAMAVGAVFALPAAGGLIARFGSRRTTALSALGLSLALPFPIVSPDAALLAVSLLVLGACNGTLDVSMNAQAVLVERRYARPIMSSFHALFSLGGLVGAGAASLALWLGARPEQHVVVSAVAALVAVVLARGALLDSRAERLDRAPVFAWPSGVLLLFGALAFFGLLAEGAMGDWGAVYLRDVLGTGAAFGGAGFACFSLAMAAGRFGGDALVRRIGAARVLRASAGTAALGLAAALVVGDPVVALVGFAVVGLGIANVIPVLFSSAGRVPGEPSGVALAAVATTGYLGLLAGPPLIGLAAEVVGLPAALGIVSAFCGLIALYGRVVERGVRPIDAAVPGAAA
jgi:fucose permease